MKKRMALLLAAVVLAYTLTGCHEADKVNHNMNVAADNFSCERRITVYNARTDKIILYAEGYMSISNNSSSELVVTCKDRVPHRVPGKRGCQAVGGKEGWLST